MELNDTLNDNVYVGFGLLIWRMSMLQVKAFFYGFISKEPNQYWQELNIMIPTGKLKPIKELNR